MNSIFTWAMPPKSNRIQYGATHNIVKTNTLGAGHAQQMDFHFTVHSLSSGHLYILVYATVVEQYTFQIS